MRARVGVYMEKSRWCFVVCCKSRLYCCLWRKEELVKSGLMVEVCLARIRCDYILRDNIVKTVCDGRGVVFCCG